jgi:hypothetical protein
MQCGVASLFEPGGIERKNDGVHCLACGKPVEASLSSLGSLRCFDCRDAHAALNRELLQDDEDYETTNAPFQERTS